MEKYNELKAAIEKLENDFQSIYTSGTKADKERFRKAMQELKEIAEEIRVLIQSKKNE